MLKYLKARKDWPLIRLILWTIVIMLVLVFFPYTALDGIGIGPYVFHTLEVDKLAQFISGITAPVLSILALILLYKTYQSQKEELHAQKVELKQNRRVLKQQSILLEKQQFESKLFSLLDIYYEIMRSFSSAESGKTYFTHIKHSLHAEHVTQAPEYDQDLPSGYFQYRSYYNYKRDDLSHYLRVLYRIFKFIDEAKILTEEDKWFYTKLVRSQLSEGELLVLFYNSFMPYGENFKMLISNYNLLKHLPITDKLEVESYYRSEFKAKPATVGSFGNGHEIEVSPANYNTNEQVENMRMFLQACEEALLEAWSKNEESENQVFFDAFLFYSIVASYADNSLHLKVVTDVQGSNHIGHFYQQLGFSETNREQELTSLLKIVLFIKVVHDSFYIFQTKEDIEFKQELKFGKSSENPLEGENSVTVSIRVKDRQHLVLLKDKF